LAEGQESETLDFKSFCDVSKHDELLELVKDIAAMQIEGGYIVIGADDYGKPTGQVPSHHEVTCKLASLRAKVSKYLAEPLVLRSRVHCP
jgi:hypothetical protein